MAISRKKSASKSPSSESTGLPVATILMFVSYVVHLIVLIAVILLTVKSPVVMTATVVVGFLVGIASVTTVEHRIAPLFVAFGLTLAPAFWMCVAEIRAAAYLELIPPVLMIVAVTWALQQPAWPAGAFTAVVVGLILLILRVSYVHRFENDYLEPDQVVTRITILASLLTLALVEVLLGIGIHITAPKKRKNRKSTGINVPTALD